MLSMNIVNYKLRYWVNIDNIKFFMLSGNPNSIHLLEKNLDNINWRWLSSNPNAIDLLEKNLDKINWFILSKNPNCYTYIREKFR